MILNKVLLLICAVDITAASDNEREPSGTRPVCVPLAAGQWQATGEG